MGKQITYTVESKGDFELKPCVDGKIELLRLVRTALLISSCNKCVFCNSYNLNTLHPAFLNGVVFECKDCGEKYIIKLN